MDRVIMKNIFVFEKQSEAAQLVDFPRNAEKATQTVHDCRQIIRSSTQAGPSCPLICDFWKFAKARMARNQFRLRYNRQQMNDSDDEEDDEPVNNYS